MKTISLSKTEVMRMFGDSRIPGLKLSGLGSDPEFEILDHSGDVIDGDGCPYDIIATGSGRDCSDCDRCSDCDPCEY